MTLDEDLKEIICDRLEGWELVEFLQIPIELIVETFEDKIQENIEDVKDFCGLREENNNNEKEY